MSSYRPDVDGLRAVAVLAVVAFHAGLPWAHGGFIGVDVFFVISGFLIGGMIRADLAAGRFSYRDFFARRARRILPAFLLVMALTVLAGWWILLPGEYQRLGQSVLYAVALIPNVFFARQPGGYFAPAADLDPLLHLWSLGVEAQFYLVIPVILVTAARWRRPTWSSSPPPTMIIMIIAATLSLVWGVAAAGTSHGFYWPWGRAWEFLAGVALAGKTASLDKPSGTLVPLVGLGVFAAAMALIGPDTPYPGFPALLPCLAATLLIGAGPGNPLTDRWLGNPVMAYLGRISYALYLWHYPALVFQRILFPASGAWGIAAALTLAALLSMATYALVEVPVRRAATGRPRAYVRPLALVVTALAVVGATLLEAGGAPSRTAAFAAQPVDRDTALRFRTCLLDATQTAADFRADLCLASSASMVLWGDSHAAHLAPGFDSLPAGQPSQLTAAGCFPGVTAGHGRCADAARLFMDHLQRLRPGTVVLAAYWQTYDNAALTAQLGETLTWLRAIGVARIVVVGPVPTWSYSVPDHVMREAMIHRTDVAATRLRQPDAMAQQLDALDRRLAHAVTVRGGEYLSPAQMLCHSGSCLVAGNGTAPVQFLYVDSNHLAPYGAKTIIGRMPLRGDVRAQLCGEAREGRGTQSFHLPRSALNWHCHTEPSSARPKTAAELLGAPAALDAGTGTAEIWMNLGESMVTVLCESSVENAHA
ncbi:MAG: acyltransferase [Sulfuritalea sp.]|nr:acyltransferase [Sulfuritalea sp.]